MPLSLGFGIALVGGAMLALAFIANAIVALVISCLCSLMLAFGLRPPASVTRRLDFTVAEELPALEAEVEAAAPAQPVSVEASIEQLPGERVSASLRLAMTLAPFLRLGLPVAGMGLLSLAFIRDDGFFWLLSLLCTAASLPMLRRRPGDAPSAGFDWNGEVHGIEVAQFGLVVMGGLALLVAYLLNSVLLLGLSIACTVMLAISLPVARRLSPWLVDAHVDIPGRDLLSFVFVLGGILALILTWLLDDWSIMRVSLGCAGMAAAGLLGSLRFGTVLVGLAALGLAYLEGSLQAMAVSVGCSLSLVGVLARDAAVGAAAVRRTRAPLAEERDAALAIGLTAVVSGLVSLSIAYMAKGSWPFFGVSVVCAVVAAISLGMSRRGVPAEDAAAVGMERSRGMRWDEAMQTAAAALDAGEPVIEARLASEIPPLEEETAEPEPSPMQRRMQEWVRPPSPVGTRVQSATEEAAAPPVELPAEEPRPQFRSFFEVFGQPAPSTGVVADRAATGDAAAQPDAQRGAVKEAPSPDTVPPRKARGRRSAPRTPVVVDKSVPRVTARLGEAPVPQVTARLDEEKPRATRRKKPVAPEPVPPQAPSRAAEPPAPAPKPRRAARAAAAPVEAPARDSAVARGAAASRAKGRKLGEGELELPFPEPAVEPAPKKGRGRKRKA